MGGCGGCGSVVVVEVLVVDVLVVEVLVVDVLVVVVLVVDVLVVDVLVVEVLVLVVDVVVGIVVEVVEVVVVVLGTCHGNVVDVVVVDELVVVVVVDGKMNGGTITSGGGVCVRPVEVSPPLVSGTPMPVSARGSFLEPISSSPFSRSARSAGVANRGGVGGFFPQT